MWLDVGGYSSLWEREYEVALPESGSREREILGFSFPPFLNLGSRSLACIQDGSSCLS